MELTLQTKIAVLMGGPGSERVISLASGKAVAEAIKSLGYEVTEVDVTGHEVVLPPGTELAYNLIHGTFGEDGELQTQLEKLGVPYTGAGVRASRICFDKAQTKEVFVKAGVPTPLSEIFTFAGSPVKPSLSLPFVVKPPREGSSVGVHIVHEESEIAPALDDVAKYDSKVLVEQFIKGRELTVSILNDQALPVIHICPRSGFYDLKNKYPWLSKTGKTDYICPADLTEEETAKVQAAALAAHKAVGIEVYSRVDVLLREDGEPFVIEINTIPGMTSSSLVPKAAAAVGMDFPSLCEEIARQSLKVQRGTGG